ncbi:hypothetical protein GPK34_00495 [Secundilactobacillus kimchicus]|uniref:hypothetical protein n=1 Tax=Secundilactobacillus kimchicus TaxID=528209 RepID=UPI001C015E94|nr:hypothetical protein [Secundilactobacillus kimchicus]MBT9670516.1 hypothetical protein [Secundilactobacillus kimchicus]
MSDWVVGKNLGFSYDGAVKPREDVALILEKQGYKSLDIPQFGEGDLSALEQIQAGESVIWQYPTYTNQPNYDLNVAKKVHAAKGFAIAIVHDVDCLRGFGGELEDAVKVLNEFDWLILLTDKLGQVLTEAGLTTRWIVRQPWDYLIDQETPVTFSYKINYAGNLTKGKTAFLNDIEIPDGVSFKLYGENSDRREFKPSLNYAGAVQPKKLPEVLTDGFGLIWDGMLDETKHHSTDENKSYWGDYAKLTWPYKLSLYFAAGLPVLATKDSNAGRLIQDLKIGFVGDTLDELMEQVKNCTPEQYHEFQDNLKPLTHNVTNGAGIRMSIYRIAMI